MTGSVTLPFWVFAVVSALAVLAMLDRILMPGARWFLRRRLNRMIAEVNERLELQIPAFQQTRRRVLIDRLRHDPQIMEAIEAEAEAAGTPREVLNRQVHRYTREIVPSFNAWVISASAISSRGAPCSSFTACGWDFPTTRRLPASNPAPASSS